MPATRPPRTVNSNTTWGRPSGWRPPHDRGDLLERDREQVVQHERQPLGRRQGVQHHQERQADRVGERRLVLGGGHGHRVGGRVGRDFPLRGPGAQHVQADPCHHRGQPAAEVAHRAGVGAAEPQPRLLDGVVGLVARPQHPQRDRPEVLPMGLEALS